MMHLLRGGFALTGILFLAVGLKFGSGVIKGVGFLFIFGSLLGPMVATSLVAYLRNPAVKYRWRVRWFMVLYFVKEYGPKIGWYLFKKGKDFTYLLWKITKAHGPTILSWLWKSVVFTGKLVFKGLRCLFEIIPTGGKVMLAGVAVFSLAVEYKDWLGLWTLLVGFAGMVIFASGAKSVFASSIKKAEQLASLIISRIKEVVRG